MNDKYAKCAKCCLAVEKEKDTKPLTTREVDGHCTDIVMVEQGLLLALPKIRDDLTLSKMEDV